MFLVVGKGSFFKDALITKLGEWGIENPVSVVAKVEQKRSVEYGAYRIMLVTC